MRDRLLAFLAAPGYRPMTKSELARALELGSDQRAEMRRALGELQREGKARAGRKARWELVATANSRGLIRGRFVVDGRGRAQLQVLEGPTAGERVPISTHGRGTALPGDEVAAELVKKPLPRQHGRRRAGEIASAEPGLEARVQQLLQRNFREVVGTLRLRGRFGWVEPLAAGLPEFELDPTEPLAGDLQQMPADGSIVTLRLSGWDSPRGRPRGSVVEVLQAASATRLAIEILIRKYHLPREFPAAVLAEAAAFPPEPDSAEFAARRDCRALPIFTIDPIDARDFDDAIVVEPLPAPEPAKPAGWRLTVHIADVSHYVAQGSALDREAEQRGNSTYLADRVIPMLPEALSNGLCSLVPQQPRLTRAVTMDFDAKGKSQGQPEFFSAVIQSQRRFHYEEVMQLFEQADRDHNGRLPGSEGPQANLVLRSLAAARRLAQVLRRRRFAQGALDLDFPELKVLCDPQGNPTGYQIERSDESHQLIEEFMLAANEVVAQKLISGSATAVHRVHDAPDLTKLFELRELAASFGIATGDLSQRQALQQLLTTVRGKPEEAAIKLAALKSMARARYDPASLGHYGLAKEAYTHFTSPIRRYADLLVHRALYGRILAKSDPAAPRVRPLPAAQASEIAEHISRTERVSAEAESESRRILLLDWLATQCHPRGVVLDGVLGEVRARSAFVDFPEMGLRGMLKREDLPEDDWRFQPARGALVGRRSGVELIPGQAVKVRPLRVDREQRFLDLSLVTATR